MRILLARTNDRFVATEVPLDKEKDFRPLFSVSGVPAAKALIRLFGITTEIQESFFNTSFAPHMYYVEAP